VTTLANPTVEINDIVVMIIPNSLTYKKGKGDKKLRAQSAGGDSIDIIPTEDAETKVSMCKFSMITTKENVEAHETWKDKTGGNTVRLSDGSFVVPFRKMYITTEPEVNTGSDGNLEIEFQGQPVQ
jgi:hypothetical protein